MWYFPACVHPIISRLAAVAAISLLFSACSSTHWPMASAQIHPLNNSSVELQLEQLADCKTGPNQKVILNPGQPLTLIVHGCRSSGGQYGALAQAFQKQGAKVRLVTVSSPFGGIQAASHCGSRTLAVLSLGLTLPICQLVTGSKWREIPPGTRFITKPGELMGAVVDHLKIVTDEAGSCRRRNSDGVCVKSDLVFSVSEQQQPAVDASSVIHEQVIKAGHVEIVGDAQKVPYKLLDILQQKHILATHLPAQQFLEELAQLYGQASSRD